jgi:hypothetical protein
MKDGGLGAPQTGRRGVYPRLRFSPSPRSSSATMPPLRPILISEYRLRELSVPVASSV